ncbi:hypothetical protein J437_LFUL003332 [Ladona fulva]|uniref:Uncharacterized protein n=1 Tax=Ladona fulva TaxID=123851 RepID=A0A8K0NZN5_LADFU|nr:hypothetical protein J437_LFUL003332 [Ladona fulva]
MVRELLGSLTQEQLKTVTEKKGDSALHLAARRKDVEMLRILVDYGTNVDIQNVSEFLVEDFSVSEDVLLLRSYLI